MKIQIRKDELWKGIIEDLGIEFLHFFFEDYVHLMDLSKGIVFLDKELKKLFPASQNSIRHADKLFKIHFKDGTEKWFLIHVEVQGYGDPEFGLRMFQSHYRISEKFKRDVTALVIFTDKNRKYHFKSYNYSFLGSELNYHFNTFILMDNPPDELAMRNNIFALALETAWYDLQRDKLEEKDLMEVKFRLVKRLFTKGYPKNKVQSLIDFIKYYVSFKKDESYNKFDESITKTSQYMGIREAIIEDVKKQAEAIGVKKGEAIGVEKGELNKAKVGIKNMWKKGFDIPTIANLLEVSIETVKKIVEQLEQEEKGID